MRDIKRSVHKKAHTEMKKAVISREGLKLIAKM